MWHPSSKGFKDNQDRNSVFEAIGFAHIYLHHPRYKAFFSHEFVIPGSLRSNRLSHFLRPVIYNSGYRGHSEKISTNFILKFDSKLLFTEKNVNTFTWM